MPGVAKVRGSPKSWIGICLQSVLLDFAQKFRPLRLHLDWPSGDVPNAIEQATDAQSCLLQRRERALEPHIINGGIQGHRSRDLNTEGEGRDVLRVSVDVSRGPGQEGGCGCGCGYKGCMYTRVYMSMYTHRSRLRIRICRY